MTRPTSPSVFLSLARWSAGSTAVRRSPLTGWPAPHQNDPSTSRGKRANPAPSGRGDAADRRTAQSRRRLGAQVRQRAVPRSPWSALCGEPAGFLEHRGGVSTTPRSSATRSPPPWPPASSMAGRSISSSRSSPTAGASGVRAMGRNRCAGDGPITLGSRERFRIFLSARRPRPKPVLCSRAADDDLRVSPMASCHPRSRLALHLSPNRSGRAHPGTIPTRRADRTTALDDVSQTRATTSSAFQQHTNGPCAIRSRFNSGPTTRRSTSGSMCAGLST